MTKLNLGCGVFKKKGFINVDFIEDVKPDILWDLNKYPYPIREDRINFITSNHLLEHLENPFKFMEEMHRILKVRGRIKIKVPHFSRGFTHPEHKRGFDVSFPMYFNKKYKAFYRGQSFKLIEMKMVWFAQPYMKKITLSKFQYYSGFVIGKFIDFFANLSPKICSRFWCFLVNGFDEINFVLEKEEDGIR